MESLIVRIGSRLRARQETLAAAESCTGGYLAHCMTTIPGASDFFLGGIVAYTNHAKTSLLGVSPMLLDQQGAVSKDVVLQMAQGVCCSFGAQYGLATSGIAGPGGGSKEKPVGTVWMAIAHPRGLWVKRDCFPQGRQPFKEKVVASLLAELDLLIPDK